MYVRGTGELRNKVAPRFPLRWLGVLWINMGFEGRVKWKANLYLMSLRYYGPSMQRKWLIFEDFSQSCINLIGLETCKYV